MGRIRTLNCWFSVLFFLLTGRLAGVGWRHRRGCPHLLGLTRRGNLVHFRALRRGLPWWCVWFEGRLEVVRPHRLPVVRVWRWTST